MSWATLGALAGLTVGAGSAGAVGLFGSASAAVPLGPMAAAGATDVPPMIESPATTTTTTPAVGTSTTTSTTQPPPPGPLTVDGTAWQGHGDLAFVSEGQLEVLGNNGTLTAITGPTGGTDTNPSWSPGGRWLAFLSTGPPTGFSVPAPTLWVVQVGHSVAQEVTSSGIGQFAWSPVSDVLAYSTRTGDGSTPGSLWTDVPGAAPSLLADVGPWLGGTDFAWTPEGTRLAFDDNVPSTIGHISSSLDTVAATGGAPQVVYQVTDDTALQLAGWWPNGGGLLFWIDTGGSGSLRADGLPLSSLAIGSSAPVQIARGLAGPQWLAPSPAGATLAVVAGGDRTLWSPGRDVERCDVPSGACQQVPIPAGTVGLAPAWTPSGGLLYAAVAAVGPGGLPGAYFPASIAQQDATGELWYLAPGAVTAQPLTQAGSGVVAAQVGTTGQAVLVVLDDALWLASLTSSGPAVKVATPLYSSVGPSGYYGEVDWTGTFAWSSAVGGSGGGGSAEAFDVSMAGPHSESP